MTDSRVLFVAVTRDSKTGPVAASYTARHSCAPSCALRVTGECYAMAGFHTRLAWNRADSALPWAEFCDKVRQLPPGKLFRHNVAGDLPHTGGRIDAKAVRQLVAALQDAKARGWTYTHHTTRAANLKLIRECNAAGFTVNLSADSLQEADKLQATGAGPVCVTVPADQPQVGTTPAGHTVRVCPAQVKAGITCERCQWCTKADRDFMVGFRAHGAKVRQLTVRLQAAQLGLQPPVKTGGK